MAACGVDQFVNAQGITNASLYHKPGIIDQVISRDNIRFCHCICKICSHAFAVGSLAWHDQRDSKKPISRSPLSSRSMMASALLLKKWKRMSGYSSCIDRMICMMEKVERCSPQPIDIAGNALFIFTKSAFGLGLICRFRRKKSEELKKGKEQLACLDYMIARVENAGEK